MANHANSTAVSCCGSSDTILSLINTYQASTSMYVEDDDGFSHMVVDVCGPIRQAIIACEAPATTLAGAHACIQLAKQEYEIGDSAMIPRLLDAALGYFQTEELAR